MHYYYDKDGEVILESMQSMYYKMDLMREDSRIEYEHNHSELNNKSHEETSKLKKIIEENSKEKLKQN